MTLKWNPVVAQRRLRAELRRLREQMGLTQREVAKALDWSPSKMIRLETGAVGIATTDLWALLRHYGITDQARVDELIELARAGKEHAWWDEFRRFFTPAFISFIATEASATLIRQFQSLLIPGMLQTEEYARAVITAFAKPEEVEPLVRARLERQRLLDQEDRPKLFFVLDEATLHRQVGGREVMQTQLARIKELATLPEISIQVVAFEQGVHPGMRGSFGIYEFPADEQSDLVVYAEQLRHNELIQNDPEEISSYLEAFYELESMATPKDQLGAIIDRILER